ncbi:MAG: hypothetical protein M1825_000863 [Sarcosagium campestre]|nr:MAG: hypothetical protein M1825_000863 [Sarcosagium campestre]
MPSITGKWADGPFPLVSTSHVDYTPGKSHPAIYFALLMAHSHNGILRALNSIYHASTAVHTPDDIADLLEYIKIWHEWLEHHHHTEEELLFPLLEDLTGIPGSMAGNVAQHEAFTPGLGALHNYALNTAPEAYDGREVREIIDGFAMELAVHLKDEIPTLTGLARLDKPSQIKDMKAIFAKFEARMRHGGEAKRMFPIVLGTADVDYESNAMFPPVPAFLFWLTRVYLEKKYTRLWRFNPCTLTRTKRPLAFVGE